MAHTAIAAPSAALSDAGATDRRDPRALMAARLPMAVQPFLTWLTARPAPGEAERSRPAWTYVSEALLWLVVGVALGVLALDSAPPLAAVLLPISLVVTSSGLGLFQVVVFHHCSHGTVFAKPEHNRNVGRLISALLLFKHFDAYRREHMLHHNARKLLTEEDEFADFVLEMCRLAPGLPKRELWRRVLVNVVFSPAFHLRFLLRRLRASLCSPDTLHNHVGIAAWLTAFVLSAASGRLVAFLVLWVLPVTLLLQVATVGRILCEHRFPEPALIAARGREFVCRATAGVFPGVVPPAASAGTLAGFLAWAAWWLNMLTVQLFVRVFVLVGDAPCHDFHHRRPATKAWTDYIHARQRDVDAGCPGYPLNYGETWGLFRAIDENLATLSRTPPEVIRPGAR
ncbi:fatty acid desaturase [Benzoatithermus flavus]|uniref:Fatty acid desaturase n=1 Tax=Benzoatithermus flavus TaxID=3108223 RepID=A0ABU8XL16_9PROT